MAKQSDRQPQPTKNYVFISYAREDQAYARSLAEELHRRGVEAWMDDRIDFGARWWRTIVKAIRNCAAFIVIMTPEAEDSDWVEKEVMLAQDEKKLIFPFLRRGRRFALLINMQYVDVTNGQLPVNRFYQRLRRVIPESKQESPAKASLTEDISDYEIIGSQPPENPSKLADLRRAVQEEEDQDNAIDPSPADAYAAVSGQRQTPTLQRSRESKPTKLPKIITPSKSFEPELILIPAGEFLMGSDPNIDKNARDNEQPQHTLHLPDYYIAKTPVTNAQYAAFVEATGHGQPEHWENDKIPKEKEDHPVVYISWQDAVAYCHWLAETTGKPYRLPTEAEWEKAARGSDGLIYPWGNQWDAKRCNNGISGPGKTTPVGSYPDGASPYGVLDMAGNVWEWTATKWGKSYPYDVEEDEWSKAYLEERGDEAGVLRGGSWWLTDERDFRCARRCGLINGCVNDGCRVAASPI